MSISVTLAQPPFHVASTVIAAVRGSNVVSPASNSLALVSNLAGECDCYILDCIESSDSKFVAVSLSDHTIKIYEWNVEHTRLRFVNQLSEHRDRINSIFFNSMLLFSASSDGSVCSWDINSCRLVRKYSVGGEAISMSIGMQGTVFAVGSHSKISIFNISTGACIRAFDDVHCDDVTDLLFHPIHQSILISASDDSLVCVLDISIIDDEDALRTCFNAESSIRKIGLFGAAFDCLFVLTCTETLSLWKVGDDCDRICHFEGLRNNLLNMYRECKLEYFINCFFDEQKNELFLFGGGQSGDLYLFRVTNTAVEKVYEMTQSSSNHVAGVRSIVWNGKELLTAGEDARICIWKVGNRSGPNLGNLSSNMSKRMVKNGSRISHLPYSRHGR